MRVYSVTEFRGEINSLFEQVVVAIRGEVSQYRISQGRFVWFSLTDGKTTIDCFLLKFQLPFELQDGMVIDAIGLPNLFQKGKFVFRPRRIELVGDGDVRKNFEALKAKLTAEGLFDASRKRALPRFPARIGLITSPDAAAYTDVLRVLRNRFAGLTIVHAPAQVQGEAAPQSLRAALSQLTAEYPDLDCIIITRGGGSSEDLVAFNDEELVRAVFACPIPVISGVGHERDVTLIDLVADVRAATPSNAAELVVPVAADVAAAVRDFTRRNQQAVHNRLLDQRRAIAGLVTALSHASRSQHTQLELLRQRLLHVGNTLRLTISGQSTRLADVQRLLIAANPQHILQRGYTLTCDDQGRILSSAASASQAGELTTQFADGQVQSRVI